MSHANDWRPEYFENLVKFYADPSDQRTIKQFADDNDIVEDTVYRFKHDHGDMLWPVVDNVRTQYISQIRSSAFRSVFANIKSSFNDRKLALQITGDLVERTENVTPVRSPEEKRARINELMEKLSNSGK